ncbi:MAG: FkbM family methyltransferase [Acidobacteriota bacterium]
MSTALCAPWLGRMIGAAYRDRIPYRGLRLDVRDADLPPVSKALLFWGLYESAEYRFVRDYLRSDLDVIEMGSGVGAISCQVARRLDPGKSLVCVEADPKLASALRRNLAAHAAHLEAHALSAAVSYEAGVGDSVWFEAKANHLGSRLAASPVDRGEVAAPQDESNAGSKSQYLEIPVKTLSEVWQQHSGGEYQLILDIEGAEVGLFECEAEALASCRVLVLECHRAEWQGEVYRVDSLIQRIEQLHHFKLADRYGPVCCFVR